MYGAQEVNPIDEKTKEFQSSAKEVVDWTADGLYIIRLRLISDPGFPVWDVSYCYGEIDGQAVRVRLPFSQLPKRNMKKALYQEAKASGKFIKGLFDNISTLQ